MGIFKDWREENSGYRYHRQIIYFFSPRVWSRLHKWRKQRADRGWSDRDTWGAGDHIAKITAEMLQHLNDNTYTDWPEWFNLNIEEKKCSYSDLQSVIDDINGYLKYQKTNWSDGLDLVSYDVNKLFEKYEDGNYGLVSDRWVDETTRKKITEKQVTSRIKKWRAEEKKLYKKATNAMSFFSRHFTQFWD